MAQPVRVMGLWADVGARHAMRAVLPPLPGPPPRPPPPNAQSARDDDVPATTDDGTDGVDGTDGTYGTAYGMGPPMRQRGQPMGQPITSFKEFRLLLISLGSPGDPYPHGCYRLALESSMFYIVTYS